MIPVYNEAGKWRAEKSQGNEQRAQAPEAGAGPDHEPELTLHSSARLHSG